MRKVAVVGFMVLVLVMVSASMVTPALAVPAVYSLTLSPDSANNVVSTQHKLTATLKLGTDPVSGKAVSWSISGVGQFVTQDLITDSSGQASAIITSNFTYPTEMGVGETTVTVSSEGQIATATKVWTRQYPSPGSATVDGNYSEWNLNWDLFANMYRAWKFDDNHPVESKLYLRYDCSTDPHTLYALVLCQPGVTIITNAGDNWIKILDLKQSPLVNGDGTPPADFAYINQGGQVIGWEASIPLAEGSYQGLVVHAEVNDGGSQTSGTINHTIGIPLVIACPLPPVPELSTIILMSLGLVALGGFGGFFWFKRQRQASPGKAS